jgi:hypothetical protein
MGSRDFFAKAQIRRFSQGRKHAEAAIEIAVMACEARHSSDQQLADLADAVDALRAGQYAVARRTCRGSTRGSFGAADRNSPHRDAAQSH